jgi:uncharacterized short protein YbdD (DUF466 family)
MRDVIGNGDLALLWRRLRQTARLMVGLPDYERYVAHIGARHPGQPVMTEAEFVAERMTRRYEGKGAGRCC